MQILLDLTIVSGDAAMNRGAHGLSLYSETSAAAVVEADRYIIKLIFIDIYRWI